MPGGSSCCPGPGQGPQRVTSVPAHRGWVRAGLCPGLLNGQSWSRPPQCCRPGAPGAPPSRAKVPWDLCSGTPWAPRWSHSSPSRLRCRPWLAGYSQEGICRILGGKGKGGMPAVGWDWVLMTPHCLVPIPGTAPAYSSVSLSGFPGSLPVWGTVCPFPGSECPSATPILRFPCSSGCDLKDGA